MSYLKGNTGKRPKVVGAAAGIAGLLTISAAIKNSVEAFNWGLLTILLVWLCLRLRSVEDSGRDGPPSAGVRSIASLTAVLGAIGAVLLVTGSAGSVDLTQPGASYLFVGGLALILTLLAWRKSGTGSGQARR